MLLYNNICSRFLINFFSFNLVKYQWYILNPWILPWKTSKKSCLFQNEWKRSCVSGTKRNVRWRKREESRSSLRNGRQKMRNKRRKNFHNNPTNNGSTKTKTNPQIGPLTGMPTGKNLNLLFTCMTGISICRSSTWFCTPTGKRSYISFKNGFLTTVFESPMLSLLSQG